MIVFPPTFVKTRYPGYFWDLDTKKLYSIKSGVLKPLAFQRGGQFGWMTVQPGYKVSVNGNKRTVTLAYLHTLKLPVTSEMVNIHGV